MSSFILCPECKYNIGKYTEFIKGCILFYKITNIKYYDNVDPSKSFFNNDFKEIYKEILDFLDFKICCRMHTITSADFYELKENATKL